MANVSGNILDIELAKERLECWRLEGIFCWVGDWKVSGIIYKLLRVENPNYHKMIPQVYIQTNFEGKLLKLCQYLFIRCEF